MGLSAGLAPRAADRALALGTLPFFRTREEVGMSSGTKSIVGRGGSEPQRAGGRVQRTTGLPRQAEPAVWGPCREPRLLC